MKRLRGETEAWIRKLFAKHVHHIRYLEGDWNVVIETGSFCPEVRSLTSLNVGRIELLAVLPPVELPHRVLMGPCGIVRAAPTATATPPVRWVPTKERGSIKGRFLERFWVLVRQNPDLIQLIVPDYESTLDVPGEHSLNTLRWLKKLTILDMGRMVVDVNVVVTALPHLERLQGDNLLGLFALQRKYPSLRALHCRCDFRISGALHILSPLPNLEELLIKKGVPEQPYKVLKEIVDAVVPFPNLTFLMVNWTWADEDRSVALLVSLFPGLRRFWTLNLGKDVREVLWRGCYDLDEIYCHRTVNGSAEAWRRRREDGEH